MVLTSNMYSYIDDGLQRLWRLHAERHRDLMRSALRAMDMHISEDLVRAVGAVLRSRRKRREYQRYLQARGPEDTSR